MDPIRYTQWSLIVDGEALRVRRWAIYEDGRRKLVSLPASEYRHLLGDRRGLEDFVIRLNNKTPDEVRLRARLRIEHAYISPQLLVEYAGYLERTVPSRKNAHRNFGYLTTHCLDYFVTSHKLRDPIEWHRQQEAWGAHLLGLDLSRAAIKQIIIETNRFIRWLHRLRPEEVPLFVFEPIEKSILRQYEARRKLDGKARESKYVIPEHRDIIFEGLKDARVCAAAHLAYSYGLREAEVMGLKPEDIWTTYLKVERQMVALPEPADPQYDVLKGREARKTPHWLADPSEAHDWISTIATKLMTPNTLCARWGAEMRRLGLDYHFHDLRHAFVTDALTDQTAREVQLAVGHKDISTTMLYAHDNREMIARPFKPGRK